MARTCMQVYSEPVARRHYAPRFGLATLFRIGNVVGAFVLSVVAAYAVGGLWPREDFYRTQPDVSFRHDVVLVLQGSDREAVFTTLPNLNDALSPARTAPGTASATPNDVNGDGKVEYFDVVVDATPGFPVHGMKLLASFDYKLDGRATMSTTALAYATLSSAVPGSLGYVDGELSLKLSNALLDNAHRAVYTENPLADFPAADGGGVHASENMTVTGLLSRYLLRNDTVTYEYTGSWESGGDGSSFKALARVRVPYHQVVPLRLRSLEMIKWGWVQVYSLLAVLLFLRRHFEEICFHYRLLPTRVVSDLEPKEHRF